MGRISRAKSSLFVLFIAIIMFAGAVELAATDSRSGDQAGEAPSAVAGDGQVKGGYALREGEKFDKTIGEFLRVDGRIQFSPAGGAAKMTVLENRAAERVDRELESTRTRRKWSVSGVVTEFRGKNFLLVKHAVLRLRSEEDESSERTARYGGVGDSTEGAATDIFGDTVHRLPFCRRGDSFARCERPQ